MDEDSACSGHFHQSLCSAASGGHLLQLQALLNGNEQEVNVPAGWDRSPPLVVAAGKGHLHVVEYLLDNVTGQMPQ